MFGLLFSNHLHAANLELEFLLSSKQRCFEGRSLGFLRQPGLQRCHLQSLDSILRYQQTELEVTFAPTSFHLPEYHRWKTTLGLKNPRNVVLAEEKQIGTSPCTLMWVDPIVSISKSSSCFFCLLQNFMSSKCVIDVWEITKGNLWKICPLSGEKGGRIILKYRRETTTTFHYVSSINPCPEIKVY